MLNYTNELALPNISHFTKHMGRGGGVGIGVLTLCSKEVEKDLHGNKGRFFSSGWHSAEHAGWGYNQGSGWGKMTCLIDAD